MVLLKKLAKMFVLSIQTKLDTDPFLLNVKRGIIQDGRRKSRRVHKSTFNLHFFLFEHFIWFSLPNQTQQCLFCWNWSTTTDFIVILSFQKLGSKVIGQRKVNFQNYRNIVMLDVKLRLFLRPTQPNQLFSIWMVRFPRNV